MDENEVEVILERSELYQYLHSLGLTEAEDIRQDLVLAQELPKEQPSWFYKYKHVFETCIWHHVKTFFGLWNRDQERILFCREAVENILKSELMMREDSYHVEFIFSKNVAPTLNGRSLTSVCLKSFPLILWSLFCYRKQFFKSLAVSATLYGIASSKHWYDSRSQRRRLNCLKSLLRLQQEYIEHLRRSACMLQANAFLDVTNITQNATIWSRVKNGESLHNMIPVLYSSVQDTVLCTMQYLHCCTNQMLTEVPVMFNIDNVHLYLCSSHWSQIESVELQSTKTGIHEIQKLKSLYQIIQSEFLRRLALIFCPDIWIGMSSDVQQSVWLLLEDIQWQYGKENVTLLKCYSLYNDYKQWDVSRDDMESLAIDWQLFDSYNVFHNALQHLKEAMHTALDIRENILTTCFLKGNLLEEETKTIVPCVIDNMSEMIIHLDNCSSCIKSSVKKLNYLIKENKEADVKESFNIKRHFENEETDVKTVQVGFSDLDPKGDYEIFEEYITNNKTDNDNDNSDYFAELLEETKHKLAKKFHKMMYSELQTALKTKVEEIKIREAEALERKKTGHTSTPLKDVSLKHEYQSTTLKDNSLSAVFVEGIDSIEACRSNSSMEETFSVLPVNETYKESPNISEQHELCNNIEDKKYEEEDREYTLTSPLNNSVSFDMANIAAQAASVAQSMLVNRLDQKTNNVFMIPSSEVITSEETFCYTPEEYEYSE